MEQKGGRRADELPGPVVCRSGSVSFGARLSVYMPFSMDNMDKTDKTQIKCLSINKLLAIFQPQAKIRLKPSNNGGLNGTHQNLGNFGCILGDR